MARTFFAQNKLLLVDDVDLNLCPSVRQIIMKLLNKTDTTILLCTNDTQLLEKVDRILAVKDDEILNNNDLPMAKAG